MKFYHEDAAEVLPELQDEAETSDSLMEQFRRVQEEQSEPARLILVFRNSADRAEFFWGLMKTRPQAMDGAERPPFALVQNWATEGGDHVSL